MVGLRLSRSPCPRGARPILEPAGKNLEKGEGLSERLGGSGKAEVRGNAAKGGSQSLG